MVRAIGNTWYQPLKPTLSDRVAFAAYLAQSADEREAVDDTTLDEPGDEPQDILPGSPDRDMSTMDQEKDLLDAMPLPRTAVDEAERRNISTALPLRVRTATRRMHRQLGHPSPSALVH